MAVAKIGVLLSVRQQKTFDERTVREKEPAVLQVRRCHLFTENRNDGLDRLHLRTFRGYGQTDLEELAEKICQRVDNHSSYVQQLAWLVWVHTDKIATERDFEEAYQDIIDQNTPLFEKQTESLTTYQMNFLRAILDGVHSEFTTQEVLRKYQLGSSANVSIVKRALVKKELIEIEKRQVIIPDPVMTVWLKRELGA